MAVTTFCIVTVGSAMVSFTWLAAVVKASEATTSDGDRTTPDWLARTFVATPLNSSTA